MQAGSNGNVEGLTSQQVRLLKLVASGVSSSKELARETGLRPASIDTYLQSASRALGVDGRKEAAQRLLQIERDSSQSASQLRSKQIANWLKTTLIGLARVARQFVFGLPVGGQFHKFTPWRIAAEVFRVALLGLAGLSLLVLLVRGIMWTFR